MCYIQESEKNEADNGLDTGTNAREWHGDDFPWNRPTDGKSDNSRCQVTDELVTLRPSGFSKM